MLKISSDTFFDRSSFDHLTLLAKMQWKTSERVVALHHVNDVESAIKMPSEPDDASEKKETLDTDFDSCTYMSPRVGPGVWGMGLNATPHNIYANKGSMGRV